MAVFFTSDHHFGDARRLGIDRRPFASRDVMDEAFVARWNEVVGLEDEVWYLGDFARTGAHAAAILERLHGRKHLIAGNNDPPETLALPGWASVGHYAEIEVEGVGLILCHYPFRTWNGMHRGRLNLHGHSHGRLKPMPRQYDVGVDVRDFRPVSLRALTIRQRASSAAGLVPRPDDL
jgi:calcineurin-like phosphoesterase family protein